VSVNIHASCVAIRGKGVLLIGASGAGKSALALQLIDTGAKLVADDRCDLSARGGKLIAAAPVSIAGLMELRGIGIVQMPYAKSIGVVLAVKLGKSRERLPPPAFYQPPAPLEDVRPVPLIVVNASDIAAGARIRAALAAFSRNSFRDTFNLE
jgi:NAD(P)-dependent dehydrogenase (short-subunit alcohol dehydrogenase family)